MLKNIAILLVIAGLWVACHRSEYFPLMGITAPAEPIQAATFKTSWKQGDYTFTPLASYDITARILHKHHYLFDEGSRLAPVDFALGWGGMSNPFNYQKLFITQDSRWYNYTYNPDKITLTPDYIATHSSNTHIIPANKDIQKIILSISAGKTVRLKGYLVQVTKADGWRWVSSLSRTDTGGGACEIMWVEEAYEL